MKRLLLIELHKLRGYRSFWVLMGMYLTSLVLFLFFFETILQGLFANEAPAIAGLTQLWDINSFPDVWQFMAYFGGMFHYILAVIIIILICNEFAYKTVRQNVINGLSRGEFLGGKMLLIFVLAAGSTILVFLISLTLGFSNSEASEIGNIFNGMSFILAYFIQTVGYMVLAFLIGILVRRTGIAIGITMLYMWFLEKVLLLLVHWGDWEAVQPWYPMQSMNSMIPIPMKDFLSNNSLPIGPSLSSMLISTGYIILFVGASYMFLRKRDL